MIIALQACRHGIGCSHLAANLAVALMQQGYRVGLLDTDSKIGGIRTLFELDETPGSAPNTYWWLTSSPQRSTTLKANCRHYHEFDDPQAAGIYLPPLGTQLTVDNPKFQFLSQRYGQEKPFDVLQQLSHEIGLDFWLIDNQPPMTDDNLLGLSLADMAIVLLQLDAYDLQRTAVLLEIIEQLEIAKTWLVPSLVLPSIEREVVRHMLENTYQYPVAGILYLSEDMISLASRGLFSLYYPNHALTQTINAIARQLEQDAQTLSMTTSDR